MSEMTREPSLSTPDRPKLQPDPSEVLFRLWSNYRKVAQTEGEDFHERNRCYAQSEAIAFAYRLCEFGPSIALHTQTEPRETYSLHEEDLRHVLREEMLLQNYDDVNMMGCVMYVTGDKTAASRHDRRKVDAALAAMRRVVKMASLNNTDVVTSSELASGS